MNEFEPPKASIASTSNQGKVPISTYFLALVSGIFVTVGVMIIVAFSPLFIGDWTSKAPRSLIAAIPYIAIVLGIVSAGQSIRQAKRKAMAKVKTG